MDLLLLLEIVLMVVSTAVITAFKVVGVSVFYGVKVYLEVKSKKVTNKKKKKKPRK
ncbi:hypothetical protein [Lysinibacillus sp. NPDC092081]|uniref:hypothetical protein n=1 Tax=Lysinibacillus sp. NPDC092081 TaxID=3364131 RepID=UPI003804E5CD